MGFAIKVLAIWAMLSVPISLLVGRILRLGDRPRARARVAELSFPVAGSTDTRAAS